MKPKLTTLANGLTVVSKTNPYTSMLNIGIWGRFGTRHEQKNLNGLAHLCEHMTFKGTKTRSELEINEQIADCGGCSEAWTEFGTTSFCLEVMKKDHEFAIELLSDLIMNSTYEEKNIALEKKIILQEMYEDKNDDDDFFQDEFLRLIYGEQSLSFDILGTPESLRQISKADLENWRQQNFVGQNLILSASGNLTHEELVDLAEKYFNQLPTGKKVINEPQVYIGGFKHIKKSDPQIRFMLGFDLNLNQGNRAAKLLLKQILGGEEVSRLNTEVRIKKSLAYDIQSNCNYENDVGYLSIESEAEAKNINKILSVTAQEIRKIQNELVTIRELARAKQQMIAILTKNMEDNRSCIETIAEQIINFDTLQDFDMLIKNVMNVTLEDIQKEAKSIFSTKLTFLLQGKLKDYYPYEKLCEMLR